MQKFTAYTGSRLEVAVWKFQNGDRAQYSVTIQRSFKKEDGGKQPKYETSEFMQERDLLALAELLREAWSWINSQE